MVPLLHDEDALYRALTTTTGLDIDQVTGYTGHHDRLVHGRGVVRTFIFTVTVTDPGRLCRTAAVGHSWTDDEETAPQAFGRF